MSSASAVPSQRLIPLSVHPLVSLYRAHSVLAVKAGKGGGGDGEGEGKQLVVLLLVFKLQSVAGAQMHESRWHL